MKLSLELRRSARTGAGNGSGKNTLSDRRSLPPFRAPDDGDYADARTCDNRNVARVAQIAAMRIAVIVLM